MLNNGVRLMSCAKLFKYVREIILPTGKFPLEKSANKKHGEFDGDF